MRTASWPLGRARAECVSVLALLVWVLFALAVVGCSGGNPTGAPTVAPALTPGHTSQTPAATEGSSVSPARTSADTRTFDACALLSPPDLAKIFGGEQPVATAVPRGGWIAGQCAWSSPGAAFLLSVGTAASIEQFGDSRAPDARARLSEFKRRMSALGTPQDVAGIGDGAVAGATGMAAYKGGMYLEVMKLHLTDRQLTQIVSLAVTGL